MPKTRIANVIVPEVFTPYVIERTAQLSALYRSGIISTSPELNRLATAGGRLINMPFWTDLVGADEVLTDAAALTVGRITAAQDVAPLLARGRAWSVNDLAKALSGDDPMRAIGDLVAEYWARRWQVALVAMLNGVFGAATMATNVYNAPAGISADETINAVQMLGDAKDKLVAFAMHSATEARLAQLDLIDFVEDSEGKLRIPTYMGKRVVVDDGLPAAPPNYTTYIFGAGAIGWGEGGAPVPVEVDRDSLASDDILINRRHFVLHPRGVRWMDAAVAGSTPTNGELGNAANWQRVYEAKNVRIVEFNHTLA